MIAVFLRLAMICGAVPVRTVEGSSPKITSRTQWIRFSIAQWPRGQVAIIDGRACSAEETELLQELLFAADDARLEMELSKRELEFMKKATGKLLSGLNAPSIFWFPLSGANSERDDF